LSKESSLNDFGLLIAYALPGYTAIWGVSYLSEALRPWAGPFPSDASTVSGFLYTTVAAVAAGMAVSTVRWLTIDTLHHCTRIHSPRWDFARLRDSAEAFGILIDVHYRYYQHYSNMVVAILFVLAARRLAPAPNVVPFSIVDVARLLVTGVFFLGSRDALRKYYARAGQLLGSSRKGART
jgi:uncharacterized membrane protein